MLKFLNPSNTFSLATKIINLTSSKSKIIYKELPLDDPKRRRPNIDKAKRNLNWIPKIQLDDGLDKTIRYFKENLLKEKV